MQFVYPVLAYLLIATVSSVCALILFAAGGSLAEVTSEHNEVLGFGFRAGGALGGFAIIFALSVRVLGKLQECGARGMSMRFYLEGNPEPFKRDNMYSGKVVLFNEDTGKRKVFEISEFRWENGRLTFDLPGVQKSHLMSITVQDSQSRLGVGCHFSGKMIAASGAAIGRRRLARYAHFV